LNRKTVLLSNKEGDFGERRRGSISLEKPKNGRKNGKESHATRLLQAHIFFFQ
jgi:hypothetical protein